MSIGKTIKEARKNAGLTQIQLGEKVYKSAQVISNWERGYTTGITAEDIKNLSTALKIPSSDLIGLYPLNETKRVPVIGTVKCGVGGLAYEYIDEYIAIDDKFRTDEMRGIRVEGDSMEPEIHAGDICLVHLQEDAPNGALVVAIILDSEECQGTIKRIHKSDGGFFLQPTNPAYSPIPFFGERVNQVRIVGQVVEVRHKTI